jgi:TRAP transporter 4TM/12TM fusion protein
MPITERGSVRRVTIAEQRNVDEIVGAHDEERPARKLSRRWERALWIIGAGVALLVLKQVFLPFDQGNQFYLVVFLAVTLPLVFLSYRPRGRRSGDGRDDPGPLDWALAAIALVVAFYPLLTGFDAFLDRQGQLSTVDVLAGAALLLLILEATRRTTGLILPIVCIAFVAYAYYGGYLPQSWSVSHAGMNIDEIISALYDPSNGFFGIPLDVAATYIVLFTIYGAVLANSGAGAFFVDFSFAVFRKSRTAPGRTTVLSGFLLGTVSGSGTATTVTLGAITWPILKKAGYPSTNAGGLLAASGIGAILSPPTLGAAAFIIAEYLETSYLTVLLWAIVPTLLYYLGIVFAVEADARRFGAHAVPLDSPKAWQVLVRGGYHFASLAIIVVFLALDIPPFSAVVYACGVAALFSLAAKLFGEDKRGAVKTWAKELVDSLSEGIRGALPVIAVCAAAGVITSTITKTGLGQVLADALVEAASALSSNQTVVLALTAQLISNNTKLKATAADTGASVQNIQQLGDKTYDIAFSLADTAADAVNGKSAFDGKPQKIQALSRIYSNYTQVVVRTDSGINSVADFRGKRISTGSPKSGTEVIANRLLQAAGLKDTDLSPQRLALRQTVDGMKEGKLDGLVWSGGLPTPEITDLTTSLKDKVKFIDITPQLDALKTVNPVYERGSIPATTYNLPADAPTIVVPNLLLVREDFPAGNACAITKLIFDKRAELEKTHPSAKELTKEIAVKSDPVPLHPGAKQALGVG